MSACYTEMGLALHFDRVKKVLRAEADRNTKNPSEVMTERKKEVNRSEHGRVVAERGRGLRTALKYLIRLTRYHSP